MFDSVCPKSPTRDRLLQAAAELMCRHSYGAVSIDDICRLADIKKGTFYHHFPSKVELALATYDYMWADCRSEMIRVAQDDGLDAGARLARFAQEIIDCHRETFAREGKVYGCPLSGAGSEMGAQDEAIRRKIVEISEEAVELMRAVVAAFPAHARASEEQQRAVARSLLCYTSGVEQNAKVANDPEVIARDLLPGLQRLVATPIME